jgi:two-component system, LytTR family, response regulator
MNTYRALVVDDEPLAREVVVDLLRRDSEIAGVTETGDPRRVAGIIAAEAPDIVFLDIEMPGLNGVEIASRVRGDSTSIVFVTAFSQYAVEAFGLAATDYLLKPFSDERFFEALDRAKRRAHERRAGGAASANDQPAEPPLTRLAVGHGGDTLTIDVSDIVWIEAEDYYVRLHTHVGRHLLRMSMAALDERLDPRLFVRAHRGAIVNVREVARFDTDAATLTLTDGAQILVSRSRRPAVERLMTTRSGDRVEPVPSADSGGGTAAGQLDTAGRRR